MADRPDAYHDNQRAQPGRPTPCWVVTGPAGSGKSLVTQLLQARGAAVVNGDRVGHEFLQDPGVIAEVIQEFGPAVCPGGTVDRNVLGNLVFSDPQALSRLNAIMFPRLADAFQQRLQTLSSSGRYPLAVLEAAVYFLLPPRGGVDLTVAVVASEELREERLVRKGRWDRREIRLRIEAQADWDQLWSRADVLLVNEGTRAQLSEKVDELLSSRLGGIQ